MSIEDLTSCLDQLNLSTDSNSDSQILLETPTDSAANLATNNILSLEDRNFIDNFLNENNISQNQLNTPTNSNSNLALNFNNMANTFKPEYLNCIPTFDGNATELNRFLSTCETLITEFYDTANPNNFQNIYLINSCNVFT